MYFVFNHTLVLQPTPIPSSFSDLQSTANIHVVTEMYEEFGAECAEVVVATGK